MKILHFSDFHLNQASNSLLKSQRLIEQMISALKRNEMERTIDLVLFTGDMVDVGGKSFCSIRQGFEIFKKWPKDHDLQAKLWNFSAFLTEIVPTISL